ncbi:MAG: hypothetical protein JNL60_04545 [Bacteroidia bacterium]|nr:hypothetical protein [Bacteroidia bacterium]
MKTTFSKFNTRPLKDVMIASLIGAVVGFLIGRWRDNDIAVFLCAAACGGAALLRAVFLWQKTKP